MLFAQPSAKEAERLQRNEEKLAHATAVYQDMSGPAMGDVQRLWDDRFELLSHILSELHTAEAVYYRQGLAMCQEMSTQHGVRLRPWEQLVDYTGISVTQSVRTPRLSVFVRSTRTENGEEKGAEGGAPSTPTQSAAPAKRPAPPKGPVPASAYQNGGAGSPASAEGNHYRVSRPEGHSDGKSPACAYPPWLHPLMVVHSRSGSPRSWRWQHKR